MCMCASVPHLANTILDNEYLSDSSEQENATETSRSKGREGPRQTRMEGEESKQALEEKQSKALLSSLILHPLLPGPLHEHGTGGGGVTVQLAVSALWPGTCLQPELHV